MSLLMMALWELRRIYPKENSAHYAIRQLLVVGPECVNQDAQVRFTH